jgi:hypothetical protein
MVSYNGHGTKMEKYIHKSVLQSISGLIGEHLHKYDDEEEDATLQWSVTRVLQILGGNSYVRHRRVPSSILRLPAHCAGPYHRRHDSTHLLTPSQARNPN